MKKSHVLILSSLSIAVLLALLSGGREPQMFVEVDPGDVPVDFGAGTTETGAISDSTTDTLRTLIAETKIRDREIKRLVERLESVEKKSVGSPSSQDNSKEDVERVNELEAQLKALTERLSDIESTATIEPVGVGLPSSRPNVLPATSDRTGGSNSTVPNIPTPNFNQLVPNLLTPGLSSDNGQESSGKGSSVPSLGVSSLGPSNQAVVWVRPSDRMVTFDKDGNEVVSYPKDIKNDSESAEKSGLDSVAVIDDTKPKSIPFYTIPANSTLAETVAMTAIIGRVPSGGAVVDPYRFKIVVGGKNLASNGFEMPYVESMVISGVAKGDFTMKCASGTIDSATFTFTDGTVHVIESSTDEALGYIADEYGVPCVPGQYISNAAEYIAMKGGLAGLGALSTALSTSEMTTLTEAGSVTEVVTGDSLVYGLGKGAAGSVDAVSDWIDQRQQSAFDAVFISAGKSLSVHLDASLEIDYNPEGRMLEHREKGFLL